MRLKNETLYLSATDLANHLACPHLTELNLGKAYGELEPPSWYDPMADVLRQKGREHERKYLEHLSDLGKRIGRIGEADEEDAFPVDQQFDSVPQALESGIDVIIQAHLGSGRWHGYADVLLRVDSDDDSDASSDLGDYHYEVVDTKLARETKGGTILQLCLYSELLARLQGRRPEFMKVVSPGRAFEPECFRVNDYLAYYRLIKNTLEQRVEQLRPGHLKSYPEPCELCMVCRWWKRCNERRRADDHPSFIAGISKSQIKELGSRQITTLQAVSEVEIPLEWRPERGSREGIERVREQARVQVEQRTTGKPVHELLDVEPGYGLTRLPEPSPHDIFFDIESARFYGEHGLQYLFGFATIENETPSFKKIWASSPEQEKAAFTSFLESVYRRWKVHDDLHVYHFGHYEPSTLKQLAQRYSTLEEELDELLRAEAFVDLHSIVKQSLRAGVEQYSLKDLEPFFGFEREMDLVDASQARHALERALEMDVSLKDVPDETRRQVLEYNRDDCLATIGLREWLESIRTGLVEQGEEISRPAPREAEISEESSERRARFHEAAQQLLEGIPLEEADRSETQQARWLLAHMLEFHRREDKAGWWEYFRMKELNDEEFFYEQTALSGLEFVASLPTPARQRRKLHRYSFPPQESKIREGHRLCSADGEIFEDEFGDVAATDYAARTVDITKKMTRTEDHPTAAFEFKEVHAKAIEDSLLRAASAVLGGEVDLDTNSGPVHDLLMRRRPRFFDGFRDSVAQDGAPGLETAIDLLSDLDGSILPIQGPPGTGKTYIGARMAASLLAEGKTVGVTANSHKVIDNFLKGLEEAGREMNVDVRTVHKDGQPNEEGQFITYINENGRVLDQLADDTFNIAGGTAWMWSREEFKHSVDVLFVDEAGQMSLANVIASAQAAKNVVLLGDPQQLDQPSKGSHPEGVDVSALDHLLGEARTMPDDRGLFLEKTWRLSRPICDYTSETFYQDRLEPIPELSNQAIATRPIDRVGLYYRFVEHQGNQSASEEEVDVIARLYEQLLHEGARWTDRDGTTAELTEDDILIVAPYNAQVSDIATALPDGARVGTVDKFQGQEAPIVIYSMTTSSREDAPRGMEFLYSLHRLNVATSRAKCACILVASPTVLQPDCRNPRQMRLANAFARYVELARQI